MSTPEKHPATADRKGSRETPGRASRNKKKQPPKNRDGERDRQHLNRRQETPNFP